MTKSIGAAACVILVVVGLFLLLRPARDQSETPTVSSPATGATLDGSPTVEAGVQQQVTPSQPPTPLTAQRTRPTPQRGPGGATAAAVSPATDQAVQAILKDRERLDATVWAPEVMAGRYGHRVHQVWDDLRLQSDKFAVLANVQFEQLMLGKPRHTEALDSGITVTEFAPGGPTLTPTAWRDWLAKFQSEGYEIIQSEWHHLEFSVPTDDEPAKSTVTMTVHATRPDESQKFIIEGKLHVVWNAEPDTEGGYHADTIEVVELTINQWRGETVFQQVAVLGESIGASRQVSPTIVYDLNGDNRPDIALPGINALFWNRGGHFEEDTLCDEPLIPITASIIADFTGDGVPDLIVAGPGKYPTLYRGGGDAGRFIGKPESITTTNSPLTFPSSIGAGDIDQDGDLDLWLTQYLPPYKNGQMPTPYYDANDGPPSYLLRNEGDGQFVDATEESGLTKKRKRRTFSNSFVDLDDDGDLDLLVVSDYSGVDVYRNEGGRFIDITDRAIDERANFGMGHAIDDFDLDGRIDFFVTGMFSNTAARLHRLGLGPAEFVEYQAMRPRMGHGNRMYVNQPDGTFRQPSFGDHVARTGWSWGTTALDLDLDGDRDLYVANGHVSGKTTNDYCTTFWRHDIYTGNSRPNLALSSFFEKHKFGAQGNDMSWNGYEHNHLLMNLDGQDYVEAGFLMDVAFELDSRSVVSEDFNGDGRPDLLIVMRTRDWSRKNSRRERVHVLENRWPTPGNWIGVRLREAKDAPSPVGAKITVTANGRKQLAHVVTGDSFLAQHAPIKRFGLGETTKVDGIQITWPNGTTHTIREPQINRYHDVPAADGNRSG